jgi:hypothetical protein
MTGDTECAEERKRGEGIPGGYLLLFNTNIQKTKIIIVLPG